MGILQSSMSYSTCIKILISKYFQVDDSDHLEDLFSPSEMSGDDDNEMNHCIMK